MSDSARAWLINEHLGRRSFLPEAAAYARGLKYNAAKRQGARTDLTSGKTCQKLTSEEMAPGAKVSERTIRNHARFASALDRVKEVHPVSVKQPPFPPRSRVTVPLVRLTEVVEAADDAFDQVHDRLCSLLGGQAKLDLRAAQVAAVELLAAAVKLRDALPESKP